MVAGRGGGQEAGFERAELQAVVRARRAVGVGRRQQQRRVVRRGGGGQLQLAVGAAVRVQGMRGWLPRCEL